MRITLLKSKIHRMVVTDANLEYEGSFSIDEDLMDLAGIREYERVDVLDVTNGNRITTYAIAGPRGSGVACANGAAAHQIHAGDVVIIAAWADFEPSEAREHVPTIVLVGKDNVVKSVKSGTALDASTAGALA
jgi:aspartate 1-decarboxylase